jgi:hypothetical protein
MVLDVTTTTWEPVRTRGAPSGLGSRSELTRSPPCRQLGHHSGTHRFRGGLLRPNPELLDTDGLDAQGKQEGDDEDGDDEASEPELNLGHDSLH